MDNTTAPRNRLSLCIAIFCCLTASAYYPRNRLGLATGARVFSFAMFAPQVKLVGGPTHRRQFGQGILPNVLQRGFPVAASRTEIMRPFTA
jgi:hypothetical protein